MENTTKIGFIGCGNMARAMINGIISSEYALPNDIYASDISAKRLQSAISETGINGAGSNAELLETVDVVVLAVKPQVVESVLTELIPSVTSSLEPKLFISIVAGWSSTSIQDILHPMSMGDQITPIVRVMPNAPAMIGRGASALCGNDYVKRSDMEIAFKIMESIGYVAVVDEELINAVTGLSGSGPAFVYLMIEALIDGGVKMGLPRAMARTYAVETVIGSAEMLKKTNMHPAELKDMITSPAGTTIDGLYALEKSGVRGALMEAVMTSAEKAFKLDDNK